MMGGENGVPDGFHPSVPPSFSLSKKFPNVQINTGGLVCHSMAQASWFTTFLHLSTFIHWVHTFSLPSQNGGRRHIVQFEDPCLYFGDGEDMPQWMGS
jgi:hypothetical protein